MSGDANGSKGGVNGSKGAIVEVDIAPGADELAAYCGKGFTHLFIYSAVI